MALISKIREKSGITIGIITVGLVIFLAGDFLVGPRSIFSGSRNKRDVGEIAGEAISLDEYQRQIDQFEQNYAQRAGRAPNEAEKNSIRNQAWQMLVSQIAFDEEYKKLGLSMSDAEIVDLVQGNNISEEIKRSFVNPETGEFDKKLLLNFLSSLNDESIDYRSRVQRIAQWNQFEETLIAARKRLKYEGAILGGDYVTDLEAKKENQDQNTESDIRYLFVSNETIPDSLIKVSDSELKAYLKAHSNDFKVSEGRTAEFVDFEIIPSAADTVTVLKEVNELKAEFKTVKEDSVFAKINTDGSTPASQTFNSVAQLPQNLQPFAAALQAGDVRGPFLSGNFYTLFKVSEIKDGGDESVKASHILFKTDGKDDKEVKAEAQKVLREIQGGANFAAMAKKYGEDGTSSRGGDLGWFSKGRMVKEFEEAAFSAKKTGLIRKLIKTEFGYHIIDVTVLPTDKQYKIAAIQKEVYPSDETIDEIYRKADFFASNSNTIGEFKQNAEKEGLKVSKAEDVDKNARRISFLSDARQAVTWLYRDAKVGQVSNVIEVGNNHYVVLALASKTEEGIADLALVKEQVEKKVQNEKKSKLIREKLNSSKKENLDEWAIAYGSDANVFSKNGLKFKDAYLPSVKYAPELVGTAFGLKEGQTSAPVVIDNGVVLVQITKKVTPQEKADYSSEKASLEGKQKSRTSSKVARAVEDQAKVKDNRYKYF